MLGLMGKKRGMAQRFTADGDMVPVTILEVGPCVVVQQKTAETDGYAALQLGYEPQREKRTTKARRGHFGKKGLPVMRTLREFRVQQPEDFAVGTELLAAAFTAGEKVHVQGTTKGRGFQGVIKRWGKHGGPAAHGSGFHRAPGSIGMRTWPRRVFKNMKLPGHMGDETVTIKNLEVVEVRPEEHLLLVKGAVPGARDGLVVVTPAADDLEGREGLRKGKSEETAAVEDTAEDKAEAQEETKE